MIDRPSSSDSGKESEDGEEMTQRPKPPNEPQPREQGPAPDSLGTPAAAEVESEEQALRREMAELGLAAVDPSTLKKGKPLSQEDWQALFRLHRAPRSMSKEERTHLRKNIRDFDTWYEADRDVLIQVAKEFGSGQGNRN